MNIVAVASSGTFLCVQRSGKAFLSISRLSLPTTTTFFLQLFLLSRRTPDKLGKMPVNSLGVSVEYSSDQDLDYLIEAVNTDGNDYAVEFTGYLKEIIGYEKVEEGEHKGKMTFKAIISNGSKSFPILIWDKATIDKWSTTFVSCLILHLDGCQGRIPLKRKFNREKPNLLNYEVIIHPTSVVIEKGVHVQSETVANTKIRTVTFTEILKSKGVIKVKAYVKTVFASAASRTGIMAFGCGSITDGIHKLPVQIASFSAQDASKMVKGSCVLVQGTVSRQGVLRLLCKDISSIQLLDTEIKMLENEVVKANKPLKRYEPKVNDGDEPKMKRNTTSGSS